MIFDKLPIVTRCGEIIVKIESTHNGISLYCSNPFKRKIGASIAMINLNDITLTAYYNVDVDYVNTNTTTLLYGKCIATVDAFNHYLHKNNKCIVHIIYHDI